MLSNLRQRNASREVPRLVPLSLRFVYALVFLILTSTCFAQSKAGSESTVLPATATADEPSEDLLKAAQNPISDLISVPILNTTNFNIGTYNRAQNVLAFQPVIPANLSENWMLISRIIQPLTWQPYPDKNSGGQFGLGDMTPSFFLAPRKAGSIIWGAGPAMVIPTATSNVLGQGKFSLGPSVVVLAQPGPWTLGTLVSNVWSVAGSGSRPAVNRMTFQYFLAYNLKHDWYLTSAPVLFADWRAQAGNKWLVPVGGGAGRLVSIGSWPVDFAATFYGNAVTPAGLPTWQMNLQMTLLFPQGQ
ncbi:MAG: hypothetical protein WAK20_14710 [Candidatus Acidiferrum sp.]